MPKFDDALRGYAHGILKRDGFRCRYCGLDGSASFENWVTLSWDHLLPRGHPDRDNPDFIVAACTFCNTADNRYFDKSAANGFDFTGLTRDELVERRRPSVERTRSEYRTFWEMNVRDGKAGGRTVGPDIG